MLIPVLMCRVVIEMVIRPIFINEIVSMSICTGRRDIPETYVGNEDIPRPMFKRINTPESNCRE